MHYFGVATRIMVIESFAVLPVLVDIVMVLLGVLNLWSWHVGRINELADRRVEFDCGREDGVGGWRSTVLV